MFQDPPSECPLCMEDLDSDDKTFFPCTCGYQICRFCWHRIKSEFQPDTSPTCPACRKPYTDSPANFKPAAELKKKGKKLKVNKKQLQELRVVQKNLIFVVGLSGRIADVEVLKRGEYFGRFGKIVKVVVNQPREPTTTASAYITYARSDDALRALTSVNNATFDNKTIKANLGTTKYCSHFLRNSACPKVECMYLHSIGEPEASFTKEDMNLGRHADYERGLVEGFLKSEREKGLRSRPPSQDSPPLNIRELTPTPPRIEEHLNLAPITPPSPPDEDEQQDPCPYEYTTDEPQSSSPPPDEEDSQDTPPPPPLALLPNHQHNQNQHHQIQLQQQPQIQMPTQPHTHTVYEDTVFDDYDPKPEFGIGMEFNPFGDTQKEFEELIQQEVREGEKLRQGLPPGLPPPGFHTHGGDTWSSLDPAIIFSRPTTMQAQQQQPQLNMFNMSLGLGNGYERHFSNYFQSPQPQHQQQHQLPNHILQNSPHHISDPYSNSPHPQQGSRMNLNYQHPPPPQAFPPPGFHPHYS